MARQLLSAKAIREGDMATAHEFTGVDLCEDEAASPNTVDTGHNSDRRRPGRLRDELSPSYLLQYTGWDEV